MTKQKSSVSSNLFTPIEKPSVSENLLSDPRIAEILQPPEEDKDKT